jgi:hypothetical protein
VLAAITARFGPVELLLPGRGFCGDRLSRRGVLFIVPCASAVKRNADKVKLSVHAKMQMRRMNFGDGIIAPLAISVTGEQGEKSKGEREKGEGGKGKG